LTEERLIPSCPGYAATSDGHIISLERTLPDGRHWGRRRISQVPRGKYLQVNFGKGCFAVHRLVLEAFIGPCPDGMECCHYDGDPSNNCIENLRWDTRKENIRDAVKHGTHVSLRQRGQGHANTHLTDLDVRWIRYLAKAGIPQKDLAEVYLVARNTISCIVHRNSWTHLPESPFPEI